MRKCRVFTFPPCFCQGKTLPNGPGIQTNKEEKGGMHDPLLLLMGEFLKLERIS
jgi:hypothetical protein